MPTVLVSRLARARVTVVLSDDGGDELFGGYERYRWLERIAAVRLRAPRPLRRPLAAAGRLARGLRAARAAAMLSLVHEASVYRRLIATGADQALLLPGTAAPPAPCFEPGLSLRRAAMLADTLAYLPDDVLVKVDRASMSVGLEARVPLLDYRILGFAAALPDSLLTNERGGKSLLRRVVERSVPGALIDRPKMVFGVPLAAWLTGPLRVSSQLT